MRRVIAVLMENEAGSLSRVVGLFSQRNFNIDSLSVAPTEDPTLSRLTLSTQGTDQVLEQIIKQLNKLVEVIKVVDLSEGPFVERETLLVKVRVTNGLRDQIMHLVTIYKGAVVDVTAEHLTVQLVGSVEKLDAFLDVVRETANVVEVARSGVIGVARGSKALHI